MKAKEALHNIALHLGSGDVTKVSEDYKPFLELSVNEGFEKTKEYLNKLKTEKPDSENRVWSRYAELSTIGLIHAVYHHMKENGEDSEIAPFNLPDSTRSGARFDNGIYIHAWTAAVMTGETEILTDLENLVKIHDETHEMKYDNAVARKNNKPRPYDKNDIQEGFDKFSRKENELGDFIAASYKKIEEIKTAETK
ncbi:MAG: hypothetical protein Q8O89_05330 [Nanoarchaeota archaeon]|nr:hypothetical protein [Nanoarchaeota archaeon]